MSSRDPVTILPSTYHTKRSAEKKDKSGKTAWYPTDVAPKKRRAPLPVQRSTEQKPTRLRKSITPGTVLIILAGQFIGRRVVFLKQLEKSGLLLVTGEYDSPADDNSEGNTQHSIAAKSSDTFHRRRMSYCRRAQPAFHNNTDSHQRCTTTDQ